MNSASQDMTQVLWWEGVRHKFHHLPFRWQDGHTYEGIGIPMIMFWADKQQLDNTYANGASNEEWMLQLTHDNGNR